MSSLQTCISRILIQKVRPSSIPTISCPDNRFSSSLSSRQSSRSCSTHTVAFRSIGPGERELFWYWGEQRACEYYRRLNVLSTNISKQVILDSASATNLMPQKGIERAMYAHIVPVSAQSQEALGNRLIDIKRYLQERPQDIQDVAYTLGAHRDHLSHRGYLLSGSTGSVSSVQFNASAVSKEPSLVFTFTGQGAHWDSMGKDLFNCFETFRRDICIMDQVLQELELHPTWKIEGCFKF